MEEGTMFFMGVLYLMCICAVPVFPLVCIFLLSAVSKTKNSNLWTLFVVLFILMVFIGGLLILWASSMSFPTSPLRISNENNIVTDTIARGVYLRIDKTTNCKTSEICFNTYNTWCAGKGCLVENKCYIDKEKASKICEGIFYPEK